MDAFAISRDFAFHPINIDLSAVGMFRVFCEKAQVCALRLFRIVPSVHPFTPRGRGGDRDWDRWGRNDGYGAENFGLKAFLLILRLADHYRLTITPPVADRSVRTGHCASLDSAFRAG